MWTPWGPGKVSCIQWSPSNVDSLGTWESVLYTEGCPHFRNPRLYCGHLAIGDLVQCLVQRGVLISGVSL